MKKYLFSLFILLIFVGATVLAQDAPAEPAPATSAEEQDTGDCTADILPRLMERRFEFANFLTQHFRSEKPASLLTEQAFERYRYYITDVRAIINEFFPEQGQLQETEVRQKAACRRFLEEELTLAREVMRQHILENVRAKKTTLLLDRYKELNQKMDRLQFNTAQLYGYIEAFSNRLPCYVESCTTR